MSGIEKALGLKLALQTDFSSAAKAAEQIGVVADGLERLKNLGSFTVPGLDEMSASIQAMEQRITAATKAFDGLGKSVAGTGSKAAAAKKNIDDVSTSTSKMEATANTASATVLRLGTSITALGGSAVIVDKVGQAFVGLAADALKAAQAVDLLEASMLRLQSAQRMPIAGGRRVGGQTALPSAYSSQYGVIPMPMGSSNRSMMLPGENYAALPPSYGSGYGPIPQPGNRSVSTEAISAGEVMLALPGGTDPNFNSKAWYANQRANNPGWDQDTGSGPTITVPPGGGGGTVGGGGFGDWFNGPGGSAVLSKIQAGADGLYRFGNDLQSTGYAQAINAVMLGGWMVPAVGQASNIQDLMKRNKEAVISGGGSSQQADQLNTSAMNTAASTGSNFQQTVGALYDFISASPENLMQKFGSDPAVQAALSSAYDRVAKMQVAGSSSQHQISMEEASLDVNNLIANLGFDTSSPQKYAQAVQDATNILINLKNRTSTQVDLAASSFRALGPIASSIGMNMDDVVGWVAAMASGKIRGMPAGQGLKRALSRQAMPVKKVQELQDYASQMTGGRDTLSMFDKNGKTKSLAQFGQEIVDFEDRNKLSDKSKAGLEGELSGIYAIPQMGLFLKSIREMGGASGFSKYGKSFRKGKVNGMDATEGSYRARTDDNVANEAMKAGNELLKERQQIFVELAPEIMSILKDVESLTQWFSKLPAPIRDGAVNALALTAAFAAVGGVMSILGGNALKVIGAFTKFGIGAVQIARVATAGEALEGLSPMVNGIGLAFRAMGTVLSGSIGTVVSWVGNIAKLAMSGEIFETLGAAVTGLGEALLAVPVVGWIAAAVIAIGAFTVAWINDWGNVREKTAAVFSWIGQEIPKIPEQIGYALGRGVEFAIQFAQNFWTALVNLPSEISTLWTNILTTLVQQGPKWMQAAADWCGSLWKGLQSGFAAIGPMLVHAVQGLVHFLDPMTWAQAGIGMAQNFIKGIQEGMQDGKPQIVKSQQQVRDLFPGSEPKDSSSAFTNMAKSGAALIENFTDGIQAATPQAVQVAAVSASDIRAGVDAIIAGKGAPKSKKGKAGASDVIIDLKPGITVTKIEADAKVIEAALVRAGATIHEKWIDLVKGNQVTRVQGDPNSFRKANSGGNDSALAQEASDYEKRLKLFPQTYEQELKKLDDLLLAATSSHTRSVIEGMIGTLIAEHKKAMDKIAKQTLQWADGSDGAGGKIKQITDQIQQESDKTKQFSQDFTEYNDKLQEAIESRKDKELPTLKELERERDIELTQQKDLTNIYQKEVETRDELVKELKELEDRTAAINGNDKESLAIKAELNHQIDTLEMQLVGVNTALQQQSVELGTVNDQVKNYTAAVTQAEQKSYEWSQVLKNAFTQAGQDATKALGDAISNSLTNTLQRVFESKRSGLIGFFGTYFSTLFGSIFQSLFSPIINSFAKNMTGNISNVLGGLLGGNSGASSHKSGPSQVQLVDEAGTDISKDVHEAVVQTADNTNGLGSISPSLGDALVAISAIPSGKSTATNDSKAQSGSNTDPNNLGINSQIQSFLKSSLAKTLEDIGGAVGGYIEATTPGTGDAGKAAGALGTYASISSIPGFGQSPVGQAVAIGASIFDLFSHQDNPQEMPDKYDTSQFGQAMANLEGAGVTPGVESAYNANGQPFTDTTSASTGGTGELQYLVQYIDQVGTAQADTTIGSQLVSELQGLSSSGNVFQPGAIHNGDVLLANGQTVPWDQLATAADGAVNAISSFEQAAAASALQMQENAQQLAASFTSLILGGPQSFAIPYLATGLGTGATINPGGGTVIGNPTPPGSPTPTPNPPPTGTPTPRPTPIGGPPNRYVIHVLENVTSIAPGTDMNSLKDAITSTIADAMPQIANGVNAQTYSQTRLMGNYTSQIGIL